MALPLLRQVGLNAGLAAVGATTVDVLEPARSVLVARRDRGLAGTMQFTYRNPERSSDPARILDGARSLVVGVLDYGPTAPEPGAGPSPSGRVARYAWKDHYRVLERGLAAIAEALGADGFQTRIVADSNALVDRNAAWRAGLGWYGKNTNLLIGGTGSWLVIGSVVTDAVVEADDVPVADGCGPCTACIDDCPTGALVAPGVLDARRCLAWFVQAAEPIPPQYRAAVGDWLYGCDICQEVCPPNRVAARRRSPSIDPSARAELDLVWVLSATDDDLLAECGRWYIADRDPDVIRRTALVVLGNVGEPDDPAVQTLVNRYLRHPRPLLRSHAVWAARRLGLDGLAEASRSDDDATVRAEWDRPVDVRHGAGR